MTSKLVNAFQAFQTSQTSKDAGAITADTAGTAPDPIHSLSPREGEILDHVARGASNKEVARALGIAETTVKIHVQHILRKLNFSSRVQAAVYRALRPV